MELRRALNVKRELLLLLLVVAVALVSSWIFDQSPLNWINALFVACYLAMRVVRVTSGRGSAP